MKTGIELIAEERGHQLTKYSLQDDLDINGGNQLAIGAMRLISGDIEVHQRVPEDWDWEQWERMCRKTYEERIVIAGALLAAELDRINASKE